MAGSGPYASIGGGWNALMDRLEERFPPPEETQGEEGEEPR
jgi:hypothetical protein